MEEALTAFLLAHTGLAALVSNRIHWNRRQQGAPLPAITLTRISGVQDYSMSGPTGLEMSRVQVDCWGSTRASATAVARQIKTILSGAQAALSGGVRMSGSFLDAHDDDFEVGAGQEPLYRTRLDFIIWHAG